MRLLIILGLVYLCCVPEIFAAPYQKKTNINEQDSLGRTAILEAASFGQAAKVAELIKKGADVNIPDIEGRTPLMWGVLSGNVELVKALIDAGANVLAKDKKGDNALVYARLAFGATTKLARGEDKYIYDGNRTQKIGPAPNEKEYSSSQQILRMVEEKTLELKAKEDALKPPETAKKESPPQPVNPPKPAPSGRLTAEELDAMKAGGGTFEAVIVNQVKNIDGLRHIDVGSLRLDTIDLVVRSEANGFTMANPPASTLSISRQMLSPADQELSKTKEIVYIKYSGSEELLFGMNVETLTKLVDMFGAALRSDERNSSFNHSFIALPVGKKTFYPPSAYVRARYHTVGEFSSGRRVEKDAYDLVFEYPTFNELRVTLSKKAALELQKLLYAALKAGEGGSK